MSDGLRDIVELFSNGGEQLVGFEGDAGQAEAEAISRRSWKPYCVVREWMLIEIEVTDEYRESLAGDGLRPCVLYASNVLAHSANKRQVGDWIRSTFQRSLTDGYVFETRNTLYILTGLGQRKKASLETVMAIVNLY